MLPERPHTLSRSCNLNGGYGGKYNGINAGLGGSVYEFLFKGLAELKGVQIRCVTLSLNDEKACFAQILADLLAENPEHLTLGQIVRLLEPQIDPVECIGHPDKCPMSDECQTRWAWREAIKVFFEKLDSITIAELADRSYKTRCEKGDHK